MNVFLLEMRNGRRATVASSICMGCVVFMMLSFAPAMKTESMMALAGTKLDGFSPAVLAALGLTKMVDFSRIDNLFGYTMQYIALAIFLIVTNRAIALLAKEESSGTIEFLYAKPISRMDVVMEKALSQVAQLAAMVLVCFVAAALGYVMFGDYSWSEAAYESAVIFGAVFFVGLMFSAVGIFISTMISGGMSPSGIGMGVVFGSFLMGVISMVVEPLSFLSWLSPMDWIKVPKLKSDGLSPQEWFVGIAVVLAFGSAGCARYKRKDLLTD